MTSSSSLRFKSTVQSLPDKNDIWMKWLSVLKDFLLLKKIKKFTIIVLYNHLGEYTLAF
jgi:hypothetical protein